MLLPPPLLLGGLAVLGLLLALVWTGPTLGTGSTAERTQSRSSATSSILALRDAAPSAEGDAVIVANSLFAAARAPWSPLPEIVEEVAEAPPPPEAPAPVVEVAPEPAPEPLAPPELVLLGYLEADGAQQALVRPAGAEEAWVKVGAEIGGWTVVEMSHAGLRLRAGADEVLVNFTR